MKKRSMSSHDYWKAREENNLRHYEEQEQGYNRKVDDLYQAMIDECSRDIEAFYAKYAKEEGITLAEAKRRAAKLDIEAYGRKAKRYVKEKNFSPQANEEMKLYNMTMKVNRLELLKSELSLEMTACADATGNTTRRSSTSAHGRRTSVRRGFLERPCRTKRRWTGWLTTSCTGPSRIRRLTAVTRRFRSGSG